MAQAISILAGAPQPKHLSVTLLLRDDALELIEHPSHEGYYNALVISFVV